MTHAPNSLRTGPDERGHFGQFGGRYVAETLMPLILDLERHYRAAQAEHPDAFPVPPGEVSFGKTPAGNLRVLLTTPTAVCHACAAAGSIVVGFDFDAMGHYLGAGVVAVA